MGLGDFWIQNNNGKQQLNNINHGVRKEQLDSKFHSLFDAFDRNGDGTLEESEFTTISSWFKRLAGDDNVLDSNENLAAKSIFEFEMAIDNTDFQGFVEAVSNAGTQIVSSTEKILPDGGKEIRTVYSDGSIETIAYYPDGAYKYKKYDYTETETTRYYTIGKDLDTHYTDEQLEAMIEEEYKKAFAIYEQELADYNNNTAAYRESGRPIPVAPRYDFIRQQFIIDNNVNIGVNTQNVERHDLEFSTRAKMDISVRQFYLEHFIATHQDAKDALDSMGYFDNIGAGINSDAGEFWNFCVNLYNSIFGEGEEEEYRSFCELLKEFSPNIAQSQQAQRDITAMLLNPAMTMMKLYEMITREDGSEVGGYERSLIAKRMLKTLEANPELYFSSFDELYAQGTPMEYNMEEVARFENIAQQYQMVSVLKFRMEKIQDAINKLEQLNSAMVAHNNSTGVEATYAYNSQVSSAEHNYEEAIRIVAEIFGDDTFAVEELMKYADYHEDITDYIDPNDPMYQMYGPAAFQCANPLDPKLAQYKGLLKALLADTQKAYDEILQKRDLTIQPMGESYISMESEPTGERWTYDALQQAYQNMYKDIYGTNYTPEDIIEGVGNAKMTGGMVKMAVITTVSILITKCPAVASMSGAGAAAEGVAANYMRTLVTRYGAETVGAAVKFAMTTGTLALDVGLTLINQLTSERGYNGEEFWESALSSAKYIYFGAYVGGPAAEAVASRIRGIGVASRMFKGGTTAMSGTVETTTITGDQLLKNIGEGGEQTLSAWQKMLSGLQKGAAKGGAFTTEVGLFAGLEVVTDGSGLLEAGSEQAQMQAKLKIMSGFLEYLLGAKTHTALGKKNTQRWNTAIEKSGIKNWTFKEVKIPDESGKGTKTAYIIENNGIRIGTLEDANQVLTVITEHVSNVYNKLETEEAQNKQDNTTPSKPEMGLKGENPGVKPIYELDFDVLINASDSAPQQVTIGAHTFQVVKCEKLSEGRSRLTTSTGDIITLDKFNRPVETVTNMYKFKYSYESDTTGDWNVTEVFDLNNGLVGKEINNSDGTTTQINYEIGMEFVQDANGNTLSSRDLAQSEYPKNVSKSSQFFKNIEQELDACHEDNEVYAIQDKYIAMGYEIPDEYYAKALRRIIAEEEGGSVNTGQTPNGQPTGAGQHNTGVKPVFELDFDALSRATTNSPCTINIAGGGFTVVKYEGLPDGYSRLTDTKGAVLILDKFNRPVEYKYGINNYKYSYNSDTASDWSLRETFDNVGGILKTKQKAEDGSNTVTDYTNGTIKTYDANGNYIGGRTLNQSEYPKNVSQTSQFYRNLQVELGYCKTIDEVKALQEKYAADGYTIPESYFTNRCECVIQEGLYNCNNIDEILQYKDKCKKEGYDIDQNIYESRLNDIVQTETQACKTIDELRALKEKCDSNGIPLNKPVYNSQIIRFIEADLQSCNTIDELNALKASYNKNGFEIPEALYNRQLFKICGVTSEDIVSSLNNCTSVDEINALRSKYKSMGLNIKDEIFDYYINKLQHLVDGVEQAIRAGNDQPVDRFGTKPFDPTDPKYTTDIDLVCIEIQTRLEKEMGVLTESQISDMVSSISLKTKIPESQVLDVMSRLTQFGNMKSLEKLADALDKYDISGFFTGGGISTNSALNYFLAKDQLTLKGSNGKQAFILDDAGLKYLERLDASAKDAFYQDVLAGNIVLIELEGTGLKVGDNYYSYTMMDGGQSLSAMTEAVLNQMQQGRTIDEVLQGDFRQRLNNVFKDVTQGDKPMDSHVETISIRTDATSKNIASQIRPNFPDADYIAKIIETVVQEHDGQLTASEKDIARSVIAKYYDYMAKVYSSDSLSVLLKNKYTDIEKQVLEMGKTMDDVVYIYPSKEYKSFNLICLQYAKINGIDPSSIIYFPGHKLDANLNGKVIVLLDDVVSSGDSMMSQQFNYKYGLSNLLVNAPTDPNINVIFAPIMCASQGNNYINGVISSSGRGGKDFLVFDPNQSSNINDFMSMLTPEEQSVFNIIVGHKGYNENALVAGFQYMTPDNNSSLGGYFNLINLNNSTVSGANKTSSSSDNVGNTLRSYLDWRRNH